MTKSKENLDAEEQAILKAYNKGELKSVENLDEEKEFAKQTASNHLKKNARINIRISSDDLLRLKQKAAFEGLPYQTLIASVLHKYAAGRLQA